MIEPQRAKLIPGFGRVKKTAIDSGALGCSISGAGPSVFALSRGKDVADEVGKRMQEMFAEEGVLADVFVSAINKEGAIKL